MSKKNLLSGRDKELQELADRYEEAQAEGRSIYLDAEDFADLADWYATHRKHELAQEVIADAMKIHPGNTSVLVENVNLLLELGQEDEAKRIAAQIEEETPEVKVLRADMLYMDGNVEEAEALIDSIEDKDDLANIIDVAYLYLDNNLPQKALQWLERGEELYKDEDAYIATLGDCYQVLGRTKEAIGLFNELIDRTPYSATLWQELARCYYDRQMFDKAIEACDYANVIDEDYGDAYMLKGQAYSQLGNDEKAFENLLQAERCHVIPHSFIDSYIGIGHCSACEWQKGYEYLEKAINTTEKRDATLTLFPQEDVYTHAAICLYNLGRKHEALECCQKVHQFDPDDTFAYIFEGRIHMEEGNVKQAMEMWTKALRIEPYADTWNEIGEHCMEIGEVGFAKYAFEKVKQMKPGYEGINEMLAALYLMLGDKKSFARFNKLCKHPIGKKELQKVKEILDNPNNNDLLTVVKQIYDSLEP